MHEGIDEIPFDELVRDYGKEVKLCQRYFESTFISGEPFSNGISGDSITTQWFDIAVFNSVKRIIPVMGYPTNDAPMSFFTPIISRYGVYGVYIGGFGRQYTWTADAEL